MTLKHNDRIHEIMDQNWFEWFIRLLEAKRKSNQINLIFSNKQESIVKELEIKTKERVPNIIIKTNVVKTEIVMQFIKEV